MEMLGNGTHIQHCTIPALSRRKLKKPYSYRRQAQAHFLTEMKKKEMSFNLYPLVHAENKGTFHLKWSIQEKEGAKEKETGKKRGRERGSELGLGTISSLIVL